jgi:hypothetical protein
MKFKNSQILIRIELDKKKQLKKIALKKKTTISKLIHDHLEKLIHDHLEKLIKKDLKND